MPQRGALLALEKEGAGNTGAAARVRLPRGSLPGYTRENKMTEAIKGLIEGLIEVAISTGMSHEDEEAFASGLERVEQEMAVLEWASEK